MKSIIFKRFNEWKNRWSDPEPMDEWTYIGESIHPEDFLLLGKLIFPEVIQHEGGIFLSRNFSLEVYQSMSARELLQIEKDINSVKLFELFEGCSDQLEESVFEEIGHMLQRSWSYYFNAIFPDKNVKVELVLDESNYGPIICFYQD